MSSWNPGYEDGDDPGDEASLFYPPLPPHLEPLSTRFLGVSPSAPAVFSPKDIGYTQQDLSLLFLDNDTQNNPNPLLEDFLITHQQYQAIDLGQEQEQQGGKGEGPTQTSSSSLMVMMKQKKTDHNAKERVRRLHLKSGYMALRSLLPESQKPKKKWSEPYLIDRAVSHIPQLEVEIEKLKSKKKDMLSELEKANELNRAEEAEKRDKILSVSINEVKKGQVILQICHQRNKVDIFSEFLDKLECEGIEVLDASVFDPCEDTSCHHIHVQMDGSSLGADYVADLKEKLVTWLN